MKRPLSGRRRQTADDRITRERGFTLIEVFVALAITLAAVTVVYGGIASALRVARVVADTREAISRARSRLDSVTDPARMLGEHSGDDGRGFRWRTNVSLAETAPPPAGASGPWSGGSALYAVTVTISWTENHASRNFALTGAVLAPRSSESP